MAISRSEVEHVAKLARLKFSQEEIEEFTVQLSKIIDYVNKLNELDTENVEPTAHIVPIHNVFREDEVKPSMDRDKILMNAPYKENGCFKVPKIIE
ncbi:aspartyl/glutamyl-tRNA(Asn/Gln) amidotransferase subunit C [Thermoanaerobacter thermohydrosulfuricus]|jgi:aspartyl-tRNA(Asn)/glutamyl-tRNA(Gln) amidotransferase subunit C|uniref:Aspartyl/glutamyl-tRNA(Asn/Gln) amidotransferase subunit C n=8 Tax=Thermoanaerobacter TaxID=1754 RepID=GATC_THEP3|nr:MULTISPECIES: Asp-tRNA(Asn)/Glu-tRNA(Gln) amidotransferase subunit GatC [Thermoanaerobacter]B0K3S2.1 RecName: Full=Aspartyl/glutamyl-tRNA(Asn/Gln) amidotransferase subunit C; Short=Asp/Glu-ADT subunit C [Thermoanaerobacter sp. X514]B0KBN5.1 RecName: Full=Aspartyl/glutamyl-tRNA(Asn/Gln) amidotransferase subunit C; Short=Asp/Glu-ADT subunit C [Thermoanaerobacter pseudethanolicus ATCC 33223]EGD51485.1 glutamyl-tRNA(Gln) amidotransferase, C subunit [Thermoanaerobacter ethanolicus JW 200]KUJ89652